MSFLTLPISPQLSVQNKSNPNLDPIEYPKQTIYKCTLCPKKFICKSSLNRHFRKHTGEKRFRCDKCIKSFSRKDILNKHKQSRKCIVRSIQFNNYERVLLSMDHSAPSSSDTSERMSISWLVSNSSSSPCISSDTYDRHNSTSPYYI